MDKDRGETRSFAGIVVITNFLMPESNTFYLSWLRRLGKGLHRKIMMQEQSLTPISMANKSHHHWRISCLRTRMGEQWSHFLFYSPYSSYGLIFEGVGGWCFELLGEDAKGSSERCTFYNRRKLQGS